MLSKIRLDRLKNKIESIWNDKRNDECRMMNDESPHSSFLIPHFLSAISIGYGAIINARESLYRFGALKSVRLPCKTISIGNLTVGGTGKTPMTIYTANLLREMGYRAAIISRGYGGQAEKSGGIVSNGSSILMNADTAGDEPFMIAKILKNFPVIVGQNRIKAGMLALKEFQPDVLIFDDAFQHLRLERDIDIVLLDSKKPFGNMRLLPRGNLREHPSALLRATAIIFSRCDFKVSSKFISGCSKLQNLKEYQISNLAIPAFISDHKPYIQTVSGSSENISENFDFLKRRKVFAFSGIAKNDNFRKTIEKFGCCLTGFLGFPDHHRYSNSDIQKIIQLAGNSDFILTTEKDFFRIYPSVRWDIDLIVVGVKITFNNEESFREFLKTRLESSSFTHVE